MKAKIFKSLLTPILGISAIVPIAVISTGCNKKKINVVNVESIILKDKAKNLSLRESVQLEATIEPEDATNKNVTWTSSNPDVATVNENGVVTAAGEGNATITVTTVDGGYQATCIISVSNENHVSGVSLNKSQLNLRIGETEQLTATVYPEDATDKRLLWESSDSSIATVSDNGTVRGKSKGTAIIVVTTIDGGHQSTCEVNVSSVQGEEITLNKKDLGLYLLDQTCSYSDDVDVTTYQLKATVKPEDASNKNVIWSSDDPSVATVDENGLVTAVGEGETRIIACLEDNQYISSRCNVKVTNFGILESDIEIPVNESKNLHISSETDYSSYSLKWETDNRRVATVDQNGVVTAVGEGTAKVTARIIVEYDDGYTVQIEASCIVYAVKIGVRLIRLEPSTMTLGVGESGKFTVIFTPSDATNKNVTWSSDDPSVATVDENGNIKALSKGRAIIKAQSEDNNKTAEAIVVVVNSSN